MVGGFRNHQGLQDVTTCVAGAWGQLPAPAHVQKQQPVLQKLPGGSVYHQEDSQASLLWAWGSLGLDDTKTAPMSSTSLCRGQEPEPQSLTSASERMPFYLSRLPHLQPHPSPPNSQLRQLSLEQVEVSCLAWGVFLMGPWGKA